MELIEKKQIAEQGAKVMVVRIRAYVNASDFISAEILDQKFERKESRDFFLEELEPEISKEIDPGIDIAKAYRLIREKEWRPAVLYLDRLETKYPGWDEIQMAKAVAYYSLNKPHRFKRALKRACVLELGLFRDQPTSPSAQVHEMKKI